MPTVVIKTASLDGFKWKVGWAGSWEIRLLKAIDIDDCLLSPEAKVIDYVPSSWCQFLASTWTDFSTMMKHGQ